MSSALGGKSKSSQSSTSTQALDPDIKKAFLENLTTAKGVARGLDVQQFAPRTGDYLAGSDIARDYATNGPGFATVDNAANTAGNIQNAGPMFISGPQARAALAGSMSYGPMFGGAAQVNGGDIANYMNPYTQDVINTSLADLDRSRRMTINDNASAATKAGAFGGSRQAVTDALTNEAFGRTAANTIANLNNQNFNTALGAAQNDVSNRQAMTLANLGFGNQAGQFAANAANTSELANMSALNNMSQFNATNQLAADTANQNNYLSTLGLNLNAANLANTIGSNQQTLGFNAANNLTNLGLADQQYQQQILDAIRNLPLEQQAIRNQALGLNPAGGSGSSNTSTSKGSGSQGSGIMGMF